MSIAKGPSVLRTRRALLVCRRKLRRETQRVWEGERRLAEQRRHIASVAHDLRAPLQTVNVALSLIAAQRNEAIERPLRLATASLARINGLLFELLDFSVLPHGRNVSLRRERHRLSELLASALEEARLRFPGRSFEESLSVEGDWVEVDANRFAQIFDNLISNAVLHGAGQLPVEVSLVTREDRLAVTIRNGGAISSAARATLFQPFAHGSAALRRGSMGLGLYIVKQLVEAHGGELELTYDLESTTVCVLLPRVDYAP